MLSAVARLGAAHSNDGPLVEAISHVLDGRGVSLRSADVETSFGRVIDGIRVPLTSTHGEVGVLHVGAPRPAWADDVAFCEALGGVLGAALVHRARLARVADVSRRAHRARRALDARVRALEGDERFVAASPAMREVVRSIGIVAAVPTTVLLLGETGTGKELVAARIHAEGRGGEPFVAVNCGAIPEGLVESELFGHDAGAFTGATRRRRGRFELAGRGTLFLDEIGELSLAAQVRLLRVLQTHEVEPVGGERAIPVTCRVIAATHRDLAKMVEQGTFRADLYYRIAAYPIVIPPLRERPLDVPVLVRTKLAMLARRLGRDVPTVSDRVMRALCARPYPGNVRELENLLERALLQSDEVLVIPEARSPMPVESRPRVFATFDDASRAILIDALTATRGKLYGEDGAAARLGLAPSTLQTKLLKYGIERTAFVPR